MGHCSADVRMTTSQLSARYKLFLQVIFNHWFFKSKTFYIGRLCVQIAGCTHGRP